MLGKYYLSIFKLLLAEYSKYADGELLELLRASDSAAFAQIYDRFHQPIYRYIITLVKLPHLTEDLVQEIFIKIWESRERLEISLNLNAYLYKMAHNRVKDMIKHIAVERRYRETLQEYYDDYLHDSDRKELELRRTNLANEALQVLSPARRKVYECCKKEGKSYQEVAIELGISVNTVKEHMVKSLEQIRAFLSDRGEVAMFILSFEIFFQNN